MLHVTTRLVALVIVACLTTDSPWEALAVFVLLTTALYTKEDCTP